MDSKEYQKQEFDIKLLSINLAFNYHLKTDETNDLNQILDKSFETSKQIQLTLKQQIYKKDPEQPYNRSYSGNV